MKILQKYLPKTTSLYLLPALLFLALVGTNIYLFRLNPNGRTPAASLSASSGSTLSSSASLLSIEKVRSLAESELPGTEITRIELESRGDRLVYEVSVPSGKKLAFDAQTGDKLSDETSEDDDKPNGKASLPVGFTPSIDFAIAREIALVQKPEGDVIKIELNADNGDVVYSVYFTDGSHVDIAATDGTLAETSADDTQTDNTEAPSTDNSPAPSESSDSTGQSDSSADSGTTEQTDGSL